MRLGFSTHTIRLFKAKRPRNRWRSTKTISKRNDQEEVLKTPRFHVAILICWTETQGKLEWGKQGKKRFFSRFPCEDPFYD